MDGEASFDGRLKYLEQCSQQLRNQMQVMKHLVTTEVDELKGTLNHQVDEIKQIIVHQDKLYQEKIRRLEMRVEQLAEFAMHLAQAKGMSGTLGGGRPGGEASSPPLGMSVGSPHRTGKSPMDTDMPQGALLGPAQDSEDEEETEGRGGINTVLQKYAEKINMVYRHYSETASRALHPIMNLTQFTKFTKDCGLCNSSQGGTVAVNAYLPPPELLWMNVLRRLKKGRRGKQGQVFAMERVQHLTTEQFPEALVILAEEQYGRNRPDMTAAQVVELFLVHDVFPVTDERIVSAQTAKAIEREKRSTPRAATSINDYYDNKEVKDALRKYKQKLKNTYKTYSRKYSPPSVLDDKLTLSLQGFSDVIKEHGLFPHINKAALREIFMNVRQARLMNAEAAEQFILSQDSENVDMKGFLMALRHVAEHIYGERTLAEKYTTPEERLNKLLSKMYLLGQ